MEVGFSQAEEEEMEFGEKEGDGLLDGNCHEPEYPHPTVLARPTHAV